MSMSNQENSDWEKLHSRTSPDIYDLHDPLSMCLLSLLSVFALLSHVVAQNNTIQITVGGPPSNPFFFSPANVTANEGDVVMFTFSGVPGNHSITQSSFESPCDPLGNGFDSGNIFIPDTKGGFPTWNLTITNTSTPIWFFCKQLAPQPHCDVGMVGSINAPSTGNTFDAFQAAARAHQGNSGQAIGFLVGQGASASAVPGPLIGSNIGFGLPDSTAIPPSTIISSTAAATNTGSSSDAISLSKINDKLLVVIALLGMFAV
ncbi:extracellular serine-rich [Pyrrhoderma noxium]|uniref:Extracellular serine-rich n=1 Tax=Pyrrhoderma noxium TaxID=2282107 RepID=A0A286UL43_9AGAM|nr:extracellular serine-rich [Pyrrhoderma noxium]